jgi:asparagine synthase (glutamine-hydrolysing)
VPTYIVSKLTREHVTVVLTGDGGDELFAGYMRFAAAVGSERVPAAAARALRAAVAPLPTPASDRHWLARARRFADAASDPLDVRMTKWNALFFDDLDALLLPDLRARVGPIDKLGYLESERDRMAGLSPLGRVLHANFTSYLRDDLLVKADRCTMANSLEARSPFLDRELIEYAAQLPDALKLRGRRTKIVLRRAFADLLPPEIDRRGKMGFGVPLGTWFRGELRDYVKDLLLAPDAAYRRFLSVSAVTRLVDDHLAGRRNLGHQLWSLICFERWLRLLPGWTRNQSTR